MLDCPISMVSRIDSAAVIEKILRHFKLWNRSERPRYLRVRDPYTMKPRLPPDDVGQLCYPNE